jgi:hypothetical protein
VLSTLCPWIASQIIPSWSRQMIAMMVPAARKQPAIHQPQFNSMSTLGTGVARAGQELGTGAGEMKPAGRL